MIKSDFKKGQTVKYNREVMFKGVETVTAKIVAIGRKTLLLDNGDEILAF